MNYKPLISYSSYLMLLHSTAVNMKCTPFHTGINNCIEHIFTSHVLGCALLHPSLNLKVTHHISLNCMSNKKNQQLHGLIFSVFGFPLFAIAKLIHCQLQIQFIQVILRLQHKLLTDLQCWSNNRLNGWPELRLLFKELVGQSAISCLVALDALTKGKKK